MKVKWSLKLFSSYTVENQMYHWHWQLIFLFFVKHVSLYFNGPTISTFQLSIAPQDVHQLKELAQGSSHDQHYNLSSNDEAKAIWVPWRRPWEVVESSENKWSFWLIWSRVTLLWGTRVNFSAQNMYRGIQTIQMVTELHALLFRTASSLSHQKNHRKKYEKIIIMTAEFQLAAPVSWSWCCACWITVMFTGAL